MTKHSALEKAIEIATEAAHSGNPMPEAIPENTYKKIIEIATQEGLIHG